MQICIAGWYYFKEFLEYFSNYKDVYIVAHRSGDFLNIPCTIIENIGLEFHCYDYFVKNIWDKRSDVLFCHDDLKIKDISFIDNLKEVKASITMVWNSETQRKKNLAHGRIFKCSYEYLNIKKGFWWDKDNHGNLYAAQGCNSGIINLYNSSKSILNHFFTNKIEMGKRGKICS
jgi:hypothetical protein